MKGRFDLVQGWLRKAASDLVAMRASARAGSLDTACFHAQQGAEKYLKAYLADQERDILHSHNLYKLIDRCSEVDVTFSELIDSAGLLTPFAVEARYDIEFWPTPQEFREAELAANRIANLVSARLLIASVENPASHVYEEWKKVRDRFNWKVDLRKFKGAQNYPGFFNRVILPGDVVSFEHSFRAALVPGGPTERAAEVAYWKNAGNHLAKDKITKQLLDSLHSQGAWTEFASAVKHVAQTPTWESCRRLITSCGQEQGFATPITFLSFYDPHRFPMVDRRIGSWWLRRFPGEPQFVWNHSGKVISPSEESWEAYLAWAKFCRRHAAELSTSGEMQWRARDVEMAVWTDVNAELPLDE